MKKVIARVSALWQRITGKAKPMGWYPVAECKPFHDQYVTVYCPNHPEMKVWPAQWDALDKCFKAGNYPAAGWFEADEVSHWMPMPLLQQMCERHWVEIAGRPIDRVDLETPRKWHDGRHTDFMGMLFGFVVARQGLEFPFIIRRDEWDRLALSQEA